MVTKCVFFFFFFNNSFIPEWNKMTLAELRVVPLLVQLLALDVIETEVKLKIVLTLGYLTDGCGK